MRKLIVLLGPRQEDIDMVADILVGDIGYQPLSFDTPTRELKCCLLDKLDGEPSAEASLAAWTARYGADEAAVRHLLIRAGWRQRELLHAPTVDALRYELEDILPELQLCALLARLTDERGSYVVADVRDKHVANLLRRMGGTVVGVQRSVPHTYGGLPVDELLNVVPPELLRERVFKIHKRLGGHDEGSASCVEAAAPMPG